MLRKLIVAVVVVVCIFLRRITGVTAFPSRSSSNNHGWHQLQPRPITGCHTFGRRFHGHYRERNNNRMRTRSIDPLYLIPIRSLQDDAPLLSILNRREQFRTVVDADGTLVLNNTAYELSFMEESDIGNVAQFIVQIFGGDAINLSQNLTTVERLILSPAVDVVNGYSSLVAFAEVYAGLRSRLSYRFQPLDNNNNHEMEFLMSPPNFYGLSPQEQTRALSSTSIVIVLATKESRSIDDRSSSSSSNMNRPNIIASVELRLQPCDAKIPFTLPWIDRMERKLFPWNGIRQRPRQNVDIQPYLSNLCVKEQYRGRGIGQLLVHSVETIASTYWGYHHLYLHVDLDNVAAVQLYKKQGYTDVGRRWNPFWAGKAVDIGYFVKNIR